MRKATRFIISTMGAFVGLMGIEHGIGEVLQGRTAPEGIFILSWPESEFFRILSGEPALTILPDLFLTGILAIAFSLAYLSWAVLFVQRKNGGMVLILLAVCMLLAGGGIFPPLFGIFIGAVAGWLPAPPDGVQNHLPPGLVSLLVKLWPWSLGACVLAWLSMFPGVPLLNYFFGFENEILIFGLLFCMICMLFLSFATALAKDLQNQPQLQHGNLAL